MRPKDIQSIDELVERNFTIYTHPLIIEATAQMEINSRLEIIMDQK